MKIQVSILILVFLTGCGSDPGNNTSSEPVLDSSPTHSIVRNTEPSLALIEGSFDWKLEVVEGDGFTISLQKENVFDVVFTTPFVEISESEVHIVDNYGAILKAIGPEKLTIGIAPLDPTPYKITFRVLGLRQ